MAKVAQDTKYTLQEILNNIFDDSNLDISVSLNSLIAGEDLTAGVMKIEQRFSGSVVTGDTLVKTGAGFLHALTF
jgi:hypothetical protein